MWLIFLLERNPPASTAKTSSMCHLGNLTISHVDTQSLKLKRLQVVQNLTFKFFLIHAVFAGLEGLLVPLDCNFYYQQNVMQSLTAEPQRKNLRECFKVRKLAVKCAQWELFQNGVFLFSISLQPYSTDVFLLCRGRAERSRRSKVSSPAESPELPVQALWQLLR